MSRDPDVTEAWQRLMATADAILEASAHHDAPALGAALQLLAAWAVARNLPPASLPHQGPGTILTDVGASDTLDVIVQRARARRAWQVLRQHEAGRHLPPWPGSAPALRARATHGEGEEAMERTIAWLAAVEARLSPRARCWPSLTYRLGAIVGLLAADDIDVADIVSRVGGGEAGLRILTQGLPAIYPVRSPHALVAFVCDEPGFAPSLLHAQRGMALQEEDVIANPLIDALCARLEATDQIALARAVLDLCHVVNADAFELPPRHVQWISQRLAKIAR